MRPEFYMGSYSFQDTSRVTVRVDTTAKHKQKTGNEGDTLSRGKTGTLSLDAIESILSRGEQRLKKIDSARVQQKKYIPAVKKKKTGVNILFPDTTQLLEHIRHLSGNQGPALINRIATYTFEMPENSTMTCRPFKKQDFSLQDTVASVAPQPVIMNRKPAYLRENWFVGALLLSFVLIIWTKIRFGKFWNKTLSGMWNNKNSFALFRNRSSLYQRTSFLLFVNYLLSGGMFIYLSFKTFERTPFGYGHSPLLIYLLIILVLAGVSLYFYTIIWLTGFFSLSQGAMSEFSHFTTLFFHNTGIYLFPLNVLIPYIYQEAVPWLIYIGYFLIAALYILRVIKLIGIFLKERFSLIFLFLYLCALEILPILIFIHLIFR